RLADAKAKGHLGGCTMTPYEYFVTSGLVNLDADLFLAVASKRHNPKGLAEICAGTAYSRWLDRRRDSITETLLRYAADHGATRPDVFRLLAHFDRPRAWELAVAAPKMAGAKWETVGVWIWQDPEAALAAVEKEQ